MPCFLIFSVTQNIGCCLLVDYDPLFEKHSSWAIADVLEKFQIVGREPAHVFETINILQCSK